MYEFWFDDLQFPVAPKEYSVKTKNQNKTMSLISGAEINIPAFPGLSEFSFSLLLPAVKYPFAVYPDGFHEPQYYFDQLEKLKAGKRPFYFQIKRRLPGGQYSFPTGIQVLLEEYTLKEGAEEGFDVTIDIKLKQYVEYLIDVINVVKSKDDGPTTVVPIPQRPAKEPVKSYTVKAGDNLWDICKKYLGDGFKCKEIATLNHISNPNLIHPGQVIRFE